MYHGDNSGLRAARTRAYILAESGRYANAHAVHQALIAEGWSNASHAMKSDYTRKAVNELCFSSNPN